MEFLGKIIVSGLMNGSVYGLVAIGFVLIYKSSKLLSFCQGNMLLFGAYSFWGFMIITGKNMFLSFMLAMVAGYLIGSLIERITLRPLIGQPILAMVLITIFLAQVLDGIVVLIWGSYPLQQIHIFPRASLAIGKMVVTTEVLYALGFAIVAMVALMLFFRYTKIGLAMRGVAEGHQTMQAMGYSVKRILNICWGIAGIVATLGGILLASTLGFQLPLGLIGILAIPAAFIGGLESPGGAILGGLMIGLVESIISGYAGQAAGPPASFVILIIVMLFKPEGFFGIKQIERV
jgi:branched-chain amino acid transport system permease protein